MDDINCFKSDKNYYKMKTRIDNWHENGKQTYL